jgi:hypothetical protein
MDTSDSAVAAREAAWHLGWIEWAYKEGLLRPGTAERYRRMVESGEAPRRELSWIKLDGDPEKVKAWAEEDDRRRDVLVSLAECVDVA